MYCLKHVSTKGADLRIPVLITDWFNNNETIEWVNKPLRILSRKLHRNHYDSLGLTPKASQADIKQAYYKLSMQFHPDKVQGDDGKFREITAAYEILGNLKLRRLYDRGMLTKDTPGHHTESEAPADPHPQQKFYDSRSQRSKVPATGRTTVYNFDEWSRAHYAETFARRENAKKDWERKLYIDDQFRSQKTVENSIWIVGMVFLVMGFLVASGGTKNHDKPSNPKKTDGS